MPGRYLRSSQGWLKNVAFIAPVASATTASTSGFIPRRRTGRLVIERTSATTVAASSIASWPIVRASLAVARQVVEQVADGLQPEPLRALGGGRRLDRQRTSSRDGRG